MINILKIEACFWLAQKDIFLTYKNFHLDIIFLFLVIQFIHVVKQERNLVMVWILFKDKELNFTFPLLWISPVNWALGYTASCARRRRLPSRVGWGSRLWHLTVSCDEACVLENVKYLFIAITPRCTLIWNGCIICKFYRLV